MNMDAKRIAELREWVKVAEGDGYTYCDDGRATADLLSLLDEKEKQIKAGAGPRIFPGVGQNPTLGGPSPGLSEDERAGANDHYAFLRKDGTWIGEDLGPAPPLPMEELVLIVTTAGGGEGGEVIPRSYRKIIRTALAFRESLPKSDKEKP
jgi:hypothetical protein